MRQKIKGKVKLKVINQNKIYDYIKFNKRKYEEIKQNEIKRDSEERKHMKNKIKQEIKVR